MKFTDGVVTYFGMIVSENWFFLYNKVYWIACCSEYVRSVHSEILNTAQM